MSPKIVVTGIGIISSIGKNAEETLNSLVNKRSGIGPISILDTIHKNDFVLGEVKLTQDELLDLAKVDPKLPWTRTALLAVIAARQAVEDAGLNPGSGDRVGIVSATTVGGMDRSELFYKDFLHKEEANPYIDTHHAGNSTEKIAETLGITDYVTTISTACSSSLNSIMFGARLLKKGIVDKVVVGGTDALSKFTLNGFNTLMILDKNLCRPFDETRTGLNLGEGAAYLVLETEDAAQKSNKHIYAEVSGYANANDAFHQTASSEDGIGPFLAMENALKVAGLKPDQIDYINVHGTGTGNNDLTEGVAIQRLFKNKVPQFSSTKAYTGHTLGAAGTVESIISILALENNLVFPNLNFGQQMNELEITPETTVSEKEIFHVLTNSFGFGGNDSSVLLSKYENQEPRIKSQEPRTKNQEPRAKNQEPRAKSQEPRTKNQEPRAKSLELRAKSQDSPKGMPSAKTPNSKLQTLNSKHQPPVYVNGMGAVAPINTFNHDQLIENELNEGRRFLQILKPNYREYINPKVLRRMSKIVRMGMVAAKTALAEGGINSPDAIITGTGMGCQADTEKFLNSMIDDKETLLNPTAFIQSTHNTIGAQIALMSQNHNYNFAYVHRTFSFESALLDSMMQIEEDDSKNILLGGIDEITEESWLIKTRIGYYKKEPIEVEHLLNDKQPGALAGESASFFILSGKKTENTYARISGVETFFRPKSQEVTDDRISSFLERHRLATKDVDLVLLGFNGDEEFDQIYQKTEQLLFGENTIGYFKHLCGEHDTASAFATWLAANILKTGKTYPVLMKEKKPEKPVQRILIYNQFRNINHSLILLEKP